MSMLSPSIGMTVAESGAHFPRREIENFTAIHVSQHHALSRLNKVRKKLDYGRRYETIPLNRFRSGRREV